MGDEKAKDFKDKCRKYSNTQFDFTLKRNRDKLLIDQALYTSHRYAIAYITLVGNIGQVKGVSDTF